MQRWPKLLLVQPGEQRGHGECGKWSCASSEPQPVLRSAQKCNYCQALCHGCHLPAVFASPTQCPGESRLFKGTRTPLGDFCVSCSCRSPGHGTGFFSSISGTLRSRQDLQYFPHSCPFLLLLLNACRHCSLSRNKWEKVLTQCQLFHTFPALQGTATRNPQQFWAYMQKQILKLLQKMHFPPPKTPEQGNKAAPQTHFPIFFLFHFLSTPKR